MKSYTPSLQKYNHCADYQSLVMYIRMVVFERLNQLGFISVGK